MEKLKKIMLGKIKEDYVSFEIAKLLKEKQFNEICRAAYTDNGKFITYHNYYSQYEDGCIAPTLQMAMKWLREEKGTSIIIEFDLTKRGYCPYVYQLDYDMDWTVKWRVNTSMKYEEAVEAALKYSLENLI